MKDSLIHIRWAGMALVANRWKKARPMSELVTYVVVCRGCGQSWLPIIKSSLWWRAKKRADAGYLDALRVSPEECGCEPKIECPEAPYRVVGFTDMGEDFDYPFTSLVEAARRYLRLARDWSNTVFFVRNLGQSGLSTTEIRLRELAGA